MHGIYLRGDVAAAKPVSWHFTVDGAEIRQHLPLNENGWHAGDGYNGTGNRMSLAIEVCENPDGDPFRAVDNAAWLCAFLRRTVKTIQHIAPHQRWSGKRCPGMLYDLPGGWDGFLRMVDGYMADKPVGIPVPIRLPDGRQLEGELREGVAWVRVAGVWVPVRPWAEHLGARVDWLGTEEGVAIRLP